MSSKAAVIAKLLDEAGRSDPATRREIEQKVGEITLEMLGEGDAKFIELSRKKNISIVTTSRYYKLPAEFFAVKDEHEVLDSNGDYVDTFTVYPEEEIFRRKRDNLRLNCRYCYIEFSQDGHGTDGRGYYLVLGDDADEDVIYVLSYFREPTENDVAAIKKEAMLLSGVRGDLPNIFGEEKAAAQRQKYLHQLPNYSEKISRIFGVIPNRPSYRVAKHNRFLHDIGRGG